MEEFVTYNATWPWPLIGPFIPSCITHRPLPTYQISMEWEKLSVDGRTDVHLPMYVRTDRQTSRSALLGRLGWVDLIKPDCCRSQQENTIKACNHLRAKTSSIVHRTVASKTHHYHHEHAPSWSVAVSTRCCQRPLSWANLHAKFRPRL